MDEMDKKEIKEVIEWCDEKGHSEHEILELIRRIVGANPKEESEKQPKERGLTETIKPRIRAVSLPLPLNTI